jgi:hypothetical protein
MIVFYLVTNLVEIQCYLLESFVLYFIDAEKTLELNFKNI